MAARIPSEPKSISDRNFRPTLKRASRGQGWNQSGKEREFQEFQSYFLLKASVKDIDLMLPASADPCLYGNKHMPV